MFLNSPVSLINVKDCYNYWMSIPCVSQIYVEVERARLTLDLAKIKEEQGDIAGAATILQDLQV